MTKIRTLALLLIISFGLGVLGFTNGISREGVSTPLTLTLPSQARVAAHTVRSRPEHITYELLFRRIDYLKQKGMLREQRSLLLEQELGLSSNHVIVLEQAAETSLSDVNIKDAQAKAIIEKKKAEHPKGKIKPGQLLPAVPQELIVMQEERNSIILRGRNFLQNQLGDEKFRAFDAKVKKEFDINIRQK